MPDLKILASDTEEYQVDTVEDIDESRTPLADDKVEVLAETKVKTVEMDEGLDLEHDEQKKMESPEGETAVKSLLEETEDQLGTDKIDIHQTQPETIESGTDVVTTESPDSVDILKDDKSVENKEMDHDECIETKSVEKDEIVKETILDDECVAQNTEKISPSLEIGEEMENDETKTISPSNIPADTISSMKSLVDAEPKEKVKENTPSENQSENENDSKENKDTPVETEALELAEEDDDALKTDGSAKS